MAPQGTKWVHFLQRTPRRRPHSLRIEPLEPRITPATFLVTNTADSGAGSLRAAIDGANADTNADTDTITIGAGAIAILGGAGENANKGGDFDILRGAGAGTLIIQGAGRNSTFIDGADLDRVFHILDGTQVIFRDLTITGGRAVDDGFNPPAMGPALGGGVLAYGAGDVAGVTSLNFERVNIIDNIAEDQFGFNAAGGGVYAFAKNVDVINSLLQGNQAIGVNGAAGADGAIPGASGGDGGNGGSASGGGLALRDTTSLTISNSTFVGNQALGGNGGDGGNGANGSVGGNGGNAGFGGSAEGGAISGTFQDASITISQTSFTNNLARGGNGGNGGDAGTGVGTADAGEGDNGSFAAGGAIAIFASNTPVALTDVVFQGNSARGGTGGQSGTAPSPSFSNASGNGGFAIGGGADFAGDGSTLTAINVTFASNAAIGGNGGVGQTTSVFGDEGGFGGDAQGGGLSAQGYNVVLNTVQILNNVATGGAGGAGSGDTTNSPSSNDAGFGGDGGEAFGGGAAIDFGFEGSDGDFTATNIVVSNNRATGGRGGDGGSSHGISGPLGDEYGVAGLAGFGGEAFGGGIATRNADVTINTATISNNQATGGDGGDSGTGIYPSFAEQSSGVAGDVFGGGLYAAGSSFGLSANLTSVQILSNRATGGAGGDGTNVIIGGDGGNAGDGGNVTGGGAAIEGLLLNLSLSSIESNIARAGNGGLGGEGGSAGYGNFQDFFGGFGGRGGFGGDVLGGGLSIRGGGGEGGGNATIFRSTIALNQLIGGAGGAGGDAGTTSPADSEPAAGGDGGFGGDALGAGVSSRFASLDIINSTISSNTGQSGAGADGGDGSDNGAGSVGDGGFGGDGGSAIGGGVFADAGYGGSFNTTIAFNSVTGASAGTGGSGGTNGDAGQAGAGHGGGVGTVSTNLPTEYELYSTIVGNNTASDIGQDLFGSFFIDFSLIETDNSDTAYSFSGANNLFNLDPQLDALANNGGTTKTHALLATSPAIDTGDNTLGLSVDQRGETRELDGNQDGVVRIDIGAYEFRFVPPDPDPDPDPEPEPEPDDPIRFGPNIFPSPESGPSLTFDGALPPPPFPIPLPQQLPFFRPPFNPGFDPSLGNQPEEDLVGVAWLRVYRVETVGGRSFDVLVRSVLVTGKNAQAASATQIMQNLPSSTYRVTLEVDNSELLVWEGEVPFGANDLASRLKRVQETIRDRTDPLRLLRERLPGAKLNKKTADDASGDNKTPAAEGEPKPAETTGSADGAAPTGTTGEAADTANEADEFFLPATPDSLSLAALRARGDLLIEATSDDETSGATDPLDGSTSEADWDLLVENALGDYEW